MGAARFELSIVVSWVRRSVVRGFAEPRLWRGLVEIVRPLAGVYFNAQATSAALDPDPVPITTNCRPDFAR